MANQQYIQVLNTDFQFEPTKIVFSSVATKKVLTCQNDGDGHEIEPGWWLIDIG